MTTVDQLRADLLQLKNAHDILDNEHKQLVQQIRDNVPSNLSNELNDIKTNYQVMQNRINDITTDAGKAFAKAAEAVNKTAADAKTADQELQKVLGQLNNEINNRTVALDNQSIKIAKEIQELIATLRSQINEYVQKANADSDARWNKAHDGLSAKLSETSMAFTTLSGSVQVGMADVSKVAEAIKPVTGVGQTTLADAMTSVATMEESVSD